MIKCKREDIYKVGWYFFNFERKNECYWSKRPSYLDGFDT
jgi:hypothetical protein